MRTGELFPHSPTPGGSRLCKQVKVRKQMKTWKITIEHIATGRRYTLPVLARTKAEALNKASGWPYTTDAYTVIKGESK